MDTKKVEKILLNLIDLKGYTSLTISFNDEHACNYASAQRFLDEWGQYSDLREWVSEKERAKAFEANSVWTAHWHPDTPVGFKTLRAASLPVLINALNAERHPEHGRKED